MEDGLEPVLNHVGEYLRQNAASEENP
jgi:hypothetical protein